MFGRKPRDAGAAPAAEPEYIACTEELVPAGQQRAAAPRPDGRIVLLPEPLPQILAQCDRFRTLRGQARHLLDAGWPEEAAGELEAGLRALIREGLLLAKADFLRALSARGQPTAVPAITIAAWVTKDRPELLARSVESLQACNRVNGKSPQYAVFDDSLDAKSAGPHSAALVELAGKRAFLDDLLRSRPDLPPALAEFALFDPHGNGLAVGANRNAVLLASIGELVMCSDDDIVFRFLSPGEPDGLELCSFHDPTSTRPYRDREELLGENALADADIMGWHERPLGRAVSACVAAAGQGLVTSRAAPALVGRLLKADPVVSATMAGIAGDCGLATPRYLLTLARDDRERVLSSEQSYHSALASREMVRAARRLTISDGRFFMATCCGLDNRELLPPFFPVGRNEDGVFAAVLRTVLRDGLVGHLPIAILHDPAGARRFEQGSLGSWAPRISDTLIMLLEDRRENHLPRSRADGLGRAGTYLQEVAALRGRDFSAYLLDRWMHGLGPYLEHLENLLRIYSDSPDYWAADIQAHTESVVDALSSPEGLVPIDLRPGRSAAEAMELCRIMIREYGQLLSWWPAIVAAARSLRESGRGLLPLAEA